MHVKMLALRYRWANLEGTDVTTNYAWERLYQAAILETDNAKLPQLIERARTTINARLGELALNGDNSAEQQAMELALQALKIVQRERCQAADSSKS